MYINSDQQSQLHQVQPRPQLHVLARRKDNRHGRISTPSRKAKTLLDDTVVSIRGTVSSAKAYLA